MSEPLGNTPRIQSIRDGIAAGRDLGVLAELVGVLDAVGVALMGLQQAVGALSVRLSALEASGHLQQQAEVAFDTTVEATGAVDTSGTP